MTCKTCAPFACLILWSIFDVSFTLFFVSHFSKVSIFNKEALNFNAATSGFDLWILSVFRSAVLLGLTVGRALSRNKSQSSGRLKKMSPFVATVTALLLTYPVVKFLVSEEYDSQGNLLVHPTHTTAGNATMTAPTSTHAQSASPRHPWLWALIGWSEVATCVVAVGYYMLAYKIKGYGYGVKLGSQMMVNAVEKDVEKEKEEEEESSSEESSSDSSGSESDSELSPLLRKRKRKKEREELKGRKGASVFRLLKLSRPDLHIILSGFCFLGVAATADTIRPYYYGKVIDTIAINRDENEFVKAIVITCILAVASSVGSGIRGMLFLLSMARLNIRVRNQLFTAVTQQEIGFFDTNRTGDITSRLTSDTTKMSDQISINLNIFLRSLARSIGSLVFMFKLSWKLTVVVLLSIPLIAIITYYYGKYYKKLSKLVQTSLAKANNVAEEVISSMRTVRSFANEKGETDKYAVKLKGTLRLNIKQALAYFGYAATSRGLELVMDIGVLYFGGWLVLNNEVTPGHLVSFILYADLLGSSLEDMGSVFTGLMQAVGAADKVFRLIDRQPKIDHSKGTVKPDVFHGSIEFQDVSFSYPSRPDSLVLKGVSFSACPGEVIALVGPSGGGKTSCINLMERFYDPSDGSVLLDGKPLAEYDHAYLHAKVAMVGQEPTLYAGTVEENILYGQKAVDWTSVEAAACLANADGFIKAMPEKYKSHTGEKGIQLSGGQKQRVAIARAVIRNPAVLLLDEATSALDAESEYLIQDAMYNKMKDKTIVVVAHRLSTVENASKIIVIDNGVVMEQGKHDELIKRDGLYAQLVRRQLRGGKE